MADDEGDDLPDESVAPFTRYSPRHGTTVACGTFGDIGLWSFGPVKVVSTGDGGMIYCRDAGMAERAERLLHVGLATPTGNDKALSFG